MLTPRAHLHVFVRHNTNACIFLLKVSKTKIFFTFAGQHVFWVLLTLGKEHALQKWFFNSIVITSNLNYLLIHLEDYKLSLIQDYKKLQPSILIHF